MIPDCTSETSNNSTTDVIHRITIDGDTRMKTHSVYVKEQQC